MKKNILSIVALVAAMFVASPAMAQFKYGVKAGLNISKVSLDKNNLTKNIAKDNQTGFFAGVMGEFTLPLVGIGVEGSLLYDQKKMDAGEDTKTLEYVDLPINLKYTLGFSSIASVYVATGPQFSWNIGGKNFSNAITPTGMIDNYNSYAQDFTLQKSEFSWNIGAGATVLKHIRVGYNYNIAIGKTANMSVEGFQDGVGVAEQLTKVKLKNNTHQVSVTYIF